MRSFWSEPYLWIHLAGIAVVPICLEVCWLGLGVGDPILPFWMELFLIAVVGIVPILWMQLFRPFSIFSIMVLALKPEELTIAQRKILALFKTNFQRLLALLAPILLVVVLWQIYIVAPIASSVLPFLDQPRIVGLLIAAIAFFLSNLFLQVPVSVLRVLITSESAFAATQPYPIEKILQDFTIPGWQVKKILPTLSVHPQQSLSSSETIIEDKTSNSSQ